MTHEPEEDHAVGPVMTIGEHFEDLRRHLWKALAGLLVGFLICLAFGNRLVIFIKAPVEEALQAYEQDVQAATPAPASAPVRLVLKRQATDQELDTAAQWNQGPHPLLKIDRASRTIAIEAEWEPPAEPARSRAPSLVTTLGPGEAFGVYIKVSLVAGLILASPYVLYQLWSFVAVGLYPHEKRFTRTLLPLAMGLFIGGAVFCYYLVFPVVLKFLFSFNAWLDIRPQVRITDWLGFAVLLPLMFAVAFQLPLAMLLLDRVGLVTADTFRKYRRHAILLCFIVAMILTPPDPMSQTLMAVPMVALYELGLVLIRFQQKPAEAEAEGLEKDRPLEG